MSNLQQIKKERENKQTLLFRECGLFWAFSDQQFAENKTPLQEGEKYVSIGAGGYLPKGKVDAFSAGMKEINKWYKKEVADNKDLRRKEIIYELGNHEAWYTHEIEDTLAALGPGYTAKEVWKVFHQELENQIA